MHVCETLPSNAMLAVLGSYSSCQSLFASALAHTKVSVRSQLVIQLSTGAQSFPPVSTFLPLRPATCDRLQTAVWLEKERSDRLRNAPIKYTKA